jgi:hypothetical protein
MCGYVTDSLDDLREEFRVMQFKGHSSGAQRGNRPTTQRLRAPYANRSHPYRLQTPMLQALRPERSYIENGLAAGRSRRQPLSNGERSTTADDD